MYVKEDDISIFIECECHEEAMGVDYDVEDKLYYFSYWSSGLSNRKLTWKERVRYCWNVLRKGKAFNDEVILNQINAEKLLDFIIENKSITEERMKHLTTLVEEKMSPSIRKQLRGEVSLKLLDIAIRTGYPIGNEVDFGLNME